MMKHIFKPSLLLTLALATSAINAAPPEPGAPGPGSMPPPGGMPPGGMGAPHSAGAVYISGGARVADHQYADGKVTLRVADNAPGVDGNRADGILLTSADYEANGIVVADGTYQFGGDKDYFTVFTSLDDDYLGTSVTQGPDKIGSFNSVLLFTVDSDVPAEAKTGSSGVDALGEAVVHIDNVYMQVDGSQRYVDSTLAQATTVINDSYFVSTGDATSHTAEIKLPFSNEALLIDGGARTNFSVGASNTYYFNSVAIAEGWATLSTDACGGGGLNLYAYNTTARALNGGYGSYADFNCHVWLYGSDLQAAEIGVIISKSGRVSVFDGASADANLLALNRGEVTEKSSDLTGGRNAVMLHAPDMMGGGISQVDFGYFDATNSTLATSRELKTTFDYGVYGPAVRKYVDYISGDVILVKSTSAAVTLDNVLLDSYNGVIFHTVLNSDRMGNFLAGGDNRALDPAGALIVKPITLSLRNMTAAGDILHDDYQRDLEVSLTSTALSGRIVQGTYESWTALWASKGVDEAHWLPDEAWSGSNFLSVTLDKDSAWTVTGASSMSRLVIEDGAIISAGESATLRMTVDGVATDIAPGIYEGAIVISPVGT